MLLISSVLALIGGFGTLRYYFRPYSVPSVSMLPTLEPGDMFFARWTPGVTPARGTVILIKANGSIRTCRVVGLPGERVAMSGGKPIINGVAANHTRIGHLMVDDSLGGRTKATILVETLPGLAVSHQIIDMGDHQFDNMDEIRLPTDHYFLLGDNRDNAADSRVDAEMSGIGLVWQGDIVGYPKVIFWSKDRNRIGKGLTH